MTADFTNSQAIKDLIGMVRTEASSWRDEPERERDPVEEAGFLDAIAKTLEEMAAENETLRDHSTLLNDMLIEASQEGAR